MKQTKIKYDNLVDRLKSGDSVSFGQIEEVFAKGFLSKFLGRVEENSKQEKFEKLYRENLSEDEFEDYPELPKEMFSEQYLETIRMVSGALGVRPSVENMSSFINQTLRQKDWKMLDKVLSLTEEGKLKSGTIEKVALETLIIERDDYSYKELKKHFGELNFTSELVGPVYNQNLSKRDLKTLERVKKETKIPIPEKVCQTSYETYLSEGDPKSITNLKRISGVTPKKTKEIRKTFKRLSKIGALSPEELYESVKLFDIDSDEKLIKDIQLGLLRNECPNTFIEFSKDVGSKLNKNELRKIYTEFDRKNNLQDIISVAEKTNIAPTSKILKKVYDNLLTGRYFEKILKFSEKTKTKPVFSKETLDNELEDSVKSTNLWAFNNIGEIMKSIDIAIPEDSIHKISLNYLNSSRENDTTTIDAIYKKHKLKPSSEVTSTKVSRLVRQLGEKILSEEKIIINENELEKSPLEPKKGENLKYYNKFKTKINRLVKNYSSSISQVKKENPECIVKDTREIQNTYQSGLELMLLQSLRNEKSFVKLGDLIKNVGVEIPKSVIGNALFKHIQHVIRSKESYSPEDISKVLSRINEKSVSLNLEEEKPNLTSALICSLTDRTSLSKRLKYLENMTGSLELSYDDKENIKKRAIENITSYDSLKISSMGNLREYDALIKLLDKKPVFNEVESKEIREKVLEDIKGNKLDNFDEIISRTGVKIKATPEEAGEIYEKYFKYSDSNKPSEIASRIGVSLPQERIEERYKELMKQFSEKKFSSWNSFISNLKELKQDTGVNLDRRYIGNFLDNIDSSDYGLLLGGFFQLFDFKYANDNLQQKYKDFIKSPDILKTLLDIHKIAPSQELANKIIEDSFNEDWLFWDYRLVEKLTHDYDVKTPKKIIQKIKVNGVNFPGTRKSKLIDKMHVINNTYNGAEHVSKADAQKVVSIIDDEFNYDHRGQNRKGTNVEDISYVYKIAGAQEQANKLATDLFYKPESIFAGYSYCAITGAKPNLPEEKLVEIREDLKDKQKYQFVFASDQKEHFYTMLNNWIGGKK
tara:strand:+ start:272 stop:3403 length:3132 start_codon:yes stop_codon:yes gene_type:complete